MASIISRPNGHRWIQFTDARGKQTLRLGYCPLKIAEEVRRRVETILCFRAAAVSLDVETASWLTRIDDDLHKRLASVRLVIPRDGALLEPFITELIDSQESEKAVQTIRNHKTAADRLYSYFDRNRDMRTITTAEAEAFAAFIRQAFASSTAGRQIRRVKWFFDTAVRRKILVENPFDHVKGTGDPDEARNVYVDRDTALKVLAKCPSVRWKLIFALARFGGLRTPSEHSTLTWDKILWDESVMMVMDSKKRKYRRVPIGPDLHPVLNEAWDLAAEGAIQVVDDVRPDSNLGTTMDKIIVAAGVETWPKTFMNLRASCETDWLRKWPVHTACKWSGNSPSVALKHYARITREDEEQAAHKKQVARDVGGSAAASPTENRADESGR